MSIRRAFTITNALGTTATKRKASSAVDDTVSRKQAKVTATDNVIYRDGVIGHKSEMASNEQLKPLNPLKRKASSLVDGAAFPKKFKSCSSGSISTAATIHAEDDAMITRLLKATRDHTTRTPEDTFAGRTYRELQRAEDRNEELMNVNLGLHQGLQEVSSAATGRVATVEQELNAFKVEARETAAKEAVGRTELQKLSDDTARRVAAAEEELDSLKKEREETAATEEAARKEQQEISDAAIQRAHTAEKELTSLNMTMTEMAAQAKLHIQEVSKAAADRDATAQAELDSLKAEMERMKQQLQAQKDETEQLKQRVTTIEDHPRVEAAEVPDAQSSGASHAGSDEDETDEKGSGVADEDDIGDIDSEDFERDLALLEDDGGRSESEDSADDLGREETPVLDDSYDEHSFDDSGLGKSIISDTDSGLQGGYATGYAIKGAATYKGPNLFGGTTPSGGFGRDIDIAQADIGDRYLDEDKVWKEEELGRSERANQMDDISHTGPAKTVSYLPPTEKISCRAALDALAKEYERSKSGSAAGSNLFKPPVGPKSNPHQPHNVPRSMTNRTSHVSVRGGVAKVGRGGIGGQRRDQTSSGPAGQGRARNNVHAHAQSRGGRGNGQQRHQDGRGRAIQDRPRNGTHAHTQVRGGRGNGPLRHQNGPGRAGQNFTRNGSNAQTTSGTRGAPSAVGNSYDVERQRAAAIRAAVDQNKMRGGRGGRR